MLQIVSENLLGTSIFVWRSSYPVSQKGQQNWKMTSLLLDNKVFYFWALVQQLRKFVLLLFCLALSMYLNVWIKTLIDKATKRKNKYVFLAA